jgi:hypothetical protein
VKPKLEVAVADRGIVDHCMEAAEFVDAHSKRLGAGDGFKVAHDYGLGLG